MQPRWWKPYKHNFEWQSMWFIMARISPCLPSYLYCFDQFIRSSHHFNNFNVLMVGLSLLFLEPLADFESKAEPPKNGSGSILTHHFPPRCHGPPLLDRGRPPPLRSRGGKSAASLHSIRSREVRYSEGDGLGPWVRSTAGKRGAYGEDYIKEWFYWH